MYICRYHIYTKRKTLSILHRCPQPKGRPFFPCLVFFSLFLAPFLVFLFIMSWDALSIPRGLTFCPFGFVDPSSLLHTDQPTDLTCGKGDKAWLIRSPGAGSFLSSGVAVAKGIIQKIPLFTQGSVHTCMARFCPSMPCPFGPIIVIAPYNQG